VKSRLVTFLFLLLAIALYALGAVLPGTLLLVLACAAEAVFWFRLFRGRRGTGN